VEGILFDQRTIERGVFEPTAIRSLLDRYYAGKEEWTIGKIALLVSLEMSLRRLAEVKQPDLKGRSSRADLAG
jgi:asparagine synthase (glutamine-hydrolysing)